MYRSKTHIGIICFVFLFLCASVWILPQDNTPRSKYLEYARAAADGIWESYDSVIARWKESFDPENVFGYRPPGGLLETAVIYAFLSAKENNAEYAARSKKILLSYENFRSLYPQWAVEKRPDYDKRPLFYLIFSRSCDTSERMTCLIDKISSLKRTK